MGDEVLRDCRGLCWADVGVMDPGRNAVYLESSQHYDVGTLPTRPEGLAAMPFDKNPVSRSILMRPRLRASLVDGIEVRPKVLVCPLELRV